MTEQKSLSWAKHAVRRWKELYNEIQRVDGNLEVSRPMSIIFRNEGLAKKLTTSDSRLQSAPPKAAPAKKDETSKPTKQPPKAPKTESKEKKTKRWFSFKLKGLKIFLNPFSSI